MCTFTKFPELPEYFI